MWKKMNEKIKSSEANQIIINAINTKINELIKTGSTQSTATDEVIEVGNEQYIPKDQENENNDLIYILPQG